MKYYLLLLFSILFLNQSFSQNPGLLGKHYIVHYNYDYQIGIHNISGDTPRINDNFEYTGWVVFKTILKGKHEIGNEFVLSRWQSVHADYAISTGFNLSNNLKYLSHEIALGYKKYYVNRRASSIAPLGNYMKPELLVLFSTYKPLGEVTEDTKIKTSKTFMQYGIGIELGRQSIVFKRVILNLAMSFGYIHFTKKEANFFSNEYSSSGYEAVWQNSPFKSISTQKFISFKVGIGLPVK